MCVFGKSQRQFKVKKYLEDDIMGGIIFGTVVMIVGALFAFAENQKTKNMSEDERWEYEWRKINKRK